MTRKRAQSSDPEANFKQVATVPTEVTPAESLTEATTPAEALTEDAPEPTPSADPVSLKLHTSDSEPIKDANLEQVKNSVQSAISEKLSKRDDSGKDPFVPSLQLENEVKSVAHEKGFSLTRGTEIGARLLAKSRRNIK